MQEGDSLTVTVTDSALAANGDIFLIAGSTASTCIEQPTVLLTDCPVTFTVTISCGNLFTNCNFDYALNTYLDSSECSSSGSTPSSPSPTTSSPSTSSSSSGCACSCCEGDGCTVAFEGYTTVRRCVERCHEMCGKDNTASEHVVSWQASDASDCSNAACIEAYPGSCPSTGTGSVLATYAATSSCKACS